MGPFSSGIPREVTRQRGITLPDKPKLSLRGDSRTQEGEPADLNPGKIVCRYLQPSANSQLAVSLSFTIHPSTHSDGQ